MVYLIGAICVLIILFLTGYLMKRKYFAEVDRYEAWKIDIMNRPVLDELSKVKQLNMTGQTEELFERWRKEWDDIVTSDLPGIEEYLFDAEDYTDKLRFKKAKEAMARIDEKLTSIEASIKNILDELNELVGSEEKNRSEIETLKEVYRESRKNLLAHRHSYGKAEAGLEDQLNSLVERFKDFDEKTENGNYLEAREIVMGIQIILQDISLKMETIPQLLHDCQTGLPAQISELKEGCREMAQQGYVLDHLGIEPEIGKVEEKVSDCRQRIDNGEIAEVGQIVNELKSTLDQLFDLLEKEVLSKQFIHKNHQETRDLLIAAIDESEKIQEEMEAVQQSYHLPDRQLDAHFIADGQLEQLTRRYELLAAKIAQGETAQSFLKEELTELKQELDDCLQEQQEFKENLNALRKDEMAARENVRELARKVTEILKLVTKSNLPGLSQNYKYLLDDAKESIQKVSDKLEQKPLDIPAVQQHLEIAELTVEKLTNTTMETVENVHLAERLIQYGNRYRSRYPSVSKGLQEAEESFRKYEYRQALEQAATAIEKVEPGVLKKIEDLFYEKQL